eukprot:2901497-Amphidinium_carterae.1
MRQCACASLLASSSLSATSMFKGKVWYVRHLAYLLPLPSALGAKMIGPATTWTASQLSAPSSEQAANWEVPVDCFLEVPKKLMKVLYYTWPLQLAQTCTLIRISN